MIIVIKTLRFYAVGFPLSFFYKASFHLRLQTYVFEVEGNSSWTDDISTRIFSNRSQFSEMRFLFWGKEGWVINSTMESQDAGGGWYELQDRRLLRFISGQRIDRPPLCTNLRNNWYAMGSRAQTRMGFNTPVALNVQHRTESLLL